jgi:hypothetical protein
LNKAPIAMFLFGFWALGNRQIFYNVPQELLFSNIDGDPMRDYLFEDDFHVVLCLLFFIFLIWFHILRKLISMFLTICPCCKETLKSD